MSNNRYMMRGVSAAKETYTTPLRTSTRVFSHRLSARLYLIFWAATLSTATSCMPTVLEQNQAWHTFTGKKRVTSPYGKVSHRMQS